MFKFTRKQLRNIKKIRQINSKNPSFIIHKLSEELQELQKALLFHDNKNKTEEVADVLIMLQQYIDDNQIANDVRSIIDYKIKRTFSFLSSDEYRYTHQLSITTSNPNTKGGEQ